MTTYGHTDDVRPTAQFMRDHIRDALNAGKKITVELSGVDHKPFYVHWPDDQGGMGSLWTGEELGEFLGSLG